MAGTALPEEVIEEILSRLPVISLLRFKSASKKWYSLFSKDDKFAKFQLKQSTLSPSSAFKNLIFYQSRVDAYDIFRYSDADSNAPRKIKFPVEIDALCRVIGSANGLICVVFYDKGYCSCYIWNPCTIEFKKISLVPFPKHVVLGLVGFGYDSICDDYKILRIWDSQIAIFSLKTNLWKKHEYSIPYCVKYPFPVSVTVLYSNGGLHWCTGPQINAFDLTKDEIFFLDLPEEISKFVGRNSSTWDVLLFTDYQGSLCVSWRKSIWVMKEYGNSKSWAKLTTFLPEEYAKPVCISRLGELVFLGNAGFVKSDIQGRMYSEDMSLMTPFPFGDAFVYTESLISPECFNRN